MSQEVANRYSEVMKLACSIGLWRTALEMLDEMEEAQGALTPQLLHFTLALDCLAKVRHCFILYVIPSVVLTICGR